MRFVCAARCLIFLLLPAGGLCGQEPPDRVPGRLLTGGRAGVDRALLDRTLKLHGVTVRSRQPELGFAVLDVPAGTVESVRASLVRSGLFAWVEPDYYAHTSAVPNDPSYVSQWHLPRIQSPQAWGVTTGAASVVVAVIDSGIYGAHPDLTPKLLPGWSFVHGSADTSDVLGHGTAVAGTVAAASNNHIGVAGVNWASQILPLVVVDEKDNATYSNIAAAIQYAADHRARVINISLGGPNDSPALENAVNYAWAKGAVVIAAAMNEGSAAPYYPAACGHAIAVAATDANDHLATFSNYGNWITLAAPGTDILTTTSGGGYSYWNGTSFAAPVVAGVAALCLAINPALSSSALAAILGESADDLGNRNYFGRGRVNAFQAVTAARESLPPTARRASPPGSGKFGGVAKTKPEPAR